MDTRSSVRRGQPSASLVRKAGATLWSSSRLRRCRLDRSDAGCTAGGRHRPTHRFARSSIRRRCLLHGGECAARIDGTRNLVAAAKAGGGRHRRPKYRVRIRAGRDLAWRPIRSPLTRRAATALRSAARSRSKSRCRERRASPRGASYDRLTGRARESIRFRRAGAVHVHAPAQAARLAVTRGAPGFTAFADDDGGFSIDKARRELGFDPAFRV